MASVSELVAAGNAAVADDELDQALSMYMRALELEPNHVDALTRRSLVLAKQAKWPAAAADCTAALAATSDASARSKLLLRRGFALFFVLLLVLTGFLFGRESRFHMGEYASALDDLTSAAVDAEPAWASACREKSAFLFYFITSCLTCTVVAAAPAAPTTQTPRCVQSPPLVLD